MRTDTRETAFAEKLEAMVKLGIAHSRMKDFYGYGAIPRELEQAFAFVTVGGQPKEPKEFLDDIRTRMDAVAKEAPEIPGRVWKNRAYIGAKEAPEVAYEMALHDAAQKSKN